MTELELLERISMLIKLLCSSLRMVGLQAAIKFVNLKSMLLFFLLFSIFSCTDNTSKVDAILLEWNEKINKQSYNELSDLYADRVDYYGQTISKNEVVSNQKVYLKKNPDYWQNVNLLAINELEDNEKEVVFTKEYGTGSKTLNKLNSSLVLVLKEGRYLIEAEHDELTNKKLVNFKEELSNSKNNNILTFKEVKKNYQQKLKGKDCIAKQEIIFLEPETYEDQKVLQAIRRNMIQDLLNSDLPTVIEAIEVYKERFMSSFVEAESKYDCDMGGWVELFETQIKLNKEILSVCKVGFIDSGGAHGLPFYACYNYDLNSGKRIKLDTPDSDIDDMINSQIRIDNNLRDSQSLEDADFDVKRIKTTKNYYFTSNQICFVYEPYEIASFGDGNSTIVCIDRTKVALSGED